MIVVGIDPGITGAVAVVSTQDEGRVKGERNGSD